MLRQTTCPINEQIIIISCFCKHGQKLDFILTFGYSFCSSKCPKRKFNYKVLHQSQVLTPLDFLVFSFRQPPVTLCFWPWFMAFVSGFKKQRDWCTNFPAKLQLIIRVLTGCLIGRMTNNTKMFSAWSVSYVPSMRHYNGRVSIIQSCSETLKEHVALDRVELVFEKRL